MNTPQNGKICELIVDLYGVLNARIHKYLCTDEMDSAPFRTTEMNQLAGCFDSLGNRLL